MEMSQMYNAAAAPVGVVWKYVRAMYPAIELYDADESHPALAGSYLAACTFYTSLFHKSPIGAAFPSGIDSLTATQIQNSAHVIFFDSLWMWNIDTSKVTANFISSIASSVVTFTNTSFNANAYLWNFGDGNFSQDINPVHSYLISGTYNITLKAFGNCRSDSITQQINIQHVGIEDISNSTQIIVFPNPAKEEINIKTGSHSFISYLIIDNKGSCVAKGDFLYDNPIKLTNISSGLYTLILTGTNIIMRKNFVIQQ